jgi:hypothetical protein
MIEASIFAKRPIDAPSALRDGRAPSATGLLRCLGALAAEAAEHGMPRTAAALYQALGIGLRESLDSALDRPSQA